MTERGQSKFAEGLEPLDQGWEVATTRDRRTGPSDLAGLDWIPAQVPGTVAGAWRAAGRWRTGQGEPFDEAEHWFRCRFRAGGETGRLLLRLGGIATIAEAWLNGERIVETDSMFEAHERDITALVQPENELAIVCRALKAAMAEKRRAPPLARWRTKVVAAQQLRWFRTAILGRAPGFAPEPAPVGPWRGVWLVRSHVKVHCRRRASIENGAGKLAVEVDLDRDAGAVQLCVGDRTVALSGQARRWSGEVVIPQVRRWWPHTHGEPCLYPARLSMELADGGWYEHVEPPVGFRELANAVEDGVAIRMNGVDIFSRGVVWTPLDAVTLQAARDPLRGRLILLREAGFNMVRVVGTAAYEDAAFHELCDELGLMVWQDAMFANMDYPFGDAAFGAKVEREAVDLCRRLARHASTVVVCGNSEIEQQAAMLGLEPDAGRGEFFGATLPAIVSRELPEVVCVPSAPTGGDLPFRGNRGVANYFGVGGYLKPVEDARRAEVRFASECLAFSNVPEPETLDEMMAAEPGSATPTHPNWKRGVPRDAQVGWDFEDVRDHYFRELFACDPMRVRYSSVERYFELSRMVTAELMSAVLGEWRRAASPCNGGVILWANDLQPGAGWGIFDSFGRPKAPYWYLKRLLAPVSVWMTDEGLNGVTIHVANDGPEDLLATLRVALYQHGERRVEQAEVPLRVKAHGDAEIPVESAIGRFVDAACAYRFGAAGHDVIVAGIEQPGIVRGKAFHFLRGLPARQEPMDRFGLVSECAVVDGTLELSLTARRLLYGVRISGRGCAPRDQYFHLEPGHARKISMGVVGPLPKSLSVTAVNAEGRAVIPLEQPA